MFKIATTPTFTWPCKVRMPVDGGTTVVHTFDVTFKRVSQAESDALVDALARREKSDQGAARELVVGWAGVQDEDGTEIPFSQSALDRLLGIFPVPGSILDAWFEVAKAARGKN